MKRHIRYSESEPALLLLDQRHLPRQEKWFVCRRVKDVIEAIQKMVVRGAPAIGVTAAYGCCLAVNTVEESDPDWHSILHEKLDRLVEARPTAVNLRWAVDIMRGSWLADPEIGILDLYWMWLKQAKDIHAEDVAANKAMGRMGSELLRDGCTVMTHCNAGALATGGYGTALGVFRAAKSAGKTVRVVANETRPLLQGARLTAYELDHDDIPVRVACDNAAGLLMAKGMIDAVLVGADRIAANGDTANKIGTYTLALLAQQHNVPFYVAAPSSTFDLGTASGEGIPIEERHSHEVTHIGNWSQVPDGVEGVNYAFDVTPSRLIHCFITEKGLIRPPYQEQIPKALRESAGARR
jgi:methylthioribose-1-phosphate isomerase